MTTDERVDEAVVQPAAEKAVSSTARHRIVVLGAATILLMVAGLALFLVDRAARVEREAQLERDVGALAQQVQRMGGTPVVAPPGEPGPEGPQGTAGRDGRDGRDGADGLPGRDGTSPPCLAEPGQCRGADGQPGTPGTDGVDGQDGTPGKDGADGQDGRDGQPPASWTWVDQAGRTQTCTRDAGSPDTAPTYTCTAPSDGPPGTRARIPLGG